MELNVHTKIILGMPNFRCAPIARRLCELGHDVPMKAEEEQAYVINWILELHEIHGVAWPDAAVALLEQEQGK